jgi:hypothetical protein
MITLSTIFFFTLLCALFLEALALNCWWMKAVQKIVTALVADTNTTLRSLLKTIEGVEKAAVAVRLSLDTQSVVVGKAVDELSNMAEGLAIEIRPDMFEPSEKANLESFIHTLEYARDKFATTIPEKRALLGTINRIKKEYGK